MVINSLFGGKGTAGPTLGRPWTRLIEASFGVGCGYSVAS